MRWNAKPPRSFPATSDSESVRARREARYVLAFPVTGSKRQLRDSLEDAGHDRRTDLGELAAHADSDDVLDATAGN